MRRHLCLVGILFLFFMCASADASDANKPSALSLMANNDKSPDITMLKKAAEQGDADAQYNLGLGYAKGIGVEQDYTEAAKWSRKAAEQGHAGGQNSLGICYVIGQGVIQDYVEAYKWFLLASANGLDESEVKNIVVKKMTQSQIAEAQKRAKEFVALKK
jgi:uncharacterized protein